VGSKALLRATVAKTDTIACPPAAQSLVRLFRGGTFTQDVTDSLLSRNGIENAEAAFERMEEAGYLVRAEIDDDTCVWWQATSLVNALAMASFGKQIRRKRRNSWPPQLPGRAYAPARGCRRRADPRHAHQGPYNDQRLHPARGKAFRSFMAEVQPGHPQLAKLRSNSS
jgi:hypothetical protein